MEHFFELLRYSLGITDSFEAKLSPEEWKKIFESAHQQSIVGVLFCGVSKLKGEFAPPLNIAMQWTAEAEKIIGMNKAFNLRAKELTEFFAQQGHHTVILKGQANARLYPNPFSRQPGDIDIFVDGGKKKVIEMLSNNNLIKSDGFVAYHHVELADETNNIAVEVHFRPSSGLHNYFGKKHLQTFLNNELKEKQLTQEGFYSPSVTFALAMQLAHIHHHFIEGGVGLRQITDYYYLLKASTNDQRNIISSLLKSIRLEQFAAALMWVLQYVFGLNEDYFLCKPNQKMGVFLFQVITNGGNFGWYNGNQSDNAIKRFLKRRIRLMKMFTLCPRDVCWEALSYTKYIVTTIPWRIRTRHLTLNG
ncbi:MAG: nucleotidyltransferase family protein [Bacteroidales bacterium]|nr:nucleotidyltransferase family protein [Bacteroidales bacterium]